MEEAFQSTVSDRKSVVLIVEDEIPIRSMVADYLRDVGFAVVEARNAGEAVAIFAALIPVDLVFTDVDMPGTMDGLMLASWVRENHPALPIIVASGVAELRNDHRADCLLQKPYSPRVLERKIRELLGEARKTNS